MKTYQDLLTVGSREDNRKKFILEAIREHKASTQYKIAVDADQYNRKLNPTIMKYQKLLYDMRGRAVPDNFTANHKIASGFFNYFVNQETQYLLGNGVSFDNDGTKARLGGSDLDDKLQDLGEAALVGGVSFGFFNIDHIEVFKITEFVPLLDEETGAIKAGIRFWQIDALKPMRCVLYELDGYTSYMQRGNKPLETLQEKRAYKLNVRTSPADGTEIVNGENYPGFPIVPLWANKHHQSEIIGIKQGVDCYDLIKSGFANDIDDASMIYWTLENCGGMDDVDLAKFIERMKTVKAAVVDGDDGAKATAHTMDVPFQGRETYLERLEKDLFRDYQALKVGDIAAGNVTATQIKAAYEPLNNKTDAFEYCVIKFLKGIMQLAGVEDEPHFVRSKIVNQLEETQMVLMAANYLDDETVLKKLPFLTPEEVDNVMKLRTAEDLDRFGNMDEDVDA